MYIRVCSNCGVSWKLRVSVCGANRRATISSMEEETREEPHVYTCIISYVLPSWKNRIMIHEPFAFSRRIIIYNRGSQYPITKFCLYSFQQIIYSHAHKTRDYKRISIPLFLLKYTPLWPSMPLYVDNRATRYLGIVLYALAIYNIYIIQTCADRRQGVNGSTVLCPYSSE